MGVAARRGFRQRGYSLLTRLHQDTSVDVNAQRVFGRRAVCLRILRGDGDYDPGKRVAESFLNDDPAARNVLMMLMRHHARLDEVNENRAAVAR